MGKRILCVNIFTLGHQGALAPQFSKTLANFEKLLLELSAARKGSKPYNAHDKTSCFCLHL